MPTQATTYNSRVTDEALEKKFRDTFKSQGGAELIDDLYASGVIMPVVDFTAAAQGSELRSDLQTAWDFATTMSTLTGVSNFSLISTPGFYQVDLICTTNDAARASPTTIAELILYDGSTLKRIWRWTTVGQAGTVPIALAEGKFVVYLRSGDTLQATVPATSETLNVWYRQIADVSGNLVNPLGFTSS
jgi:hypothetical protein|tara:strand:+ start:603 stop:1169 length:567 start_codon:yes stop_codon:yes gene_type:complete